MLRHPKLRPSSIINAMRFREKVRDQRLKDEQARTNHKVDDDTTPANPVIVEAVEKVFDKQPVTDIKPIALASNLDVASEPVFEFSTEAVQQAKL